MFSLATEPHVWASPVLCWTNYSGAATYVLMQRSASPVVCPIFLLHPQVGKSGNHNRIATMEVNAFLSAPSDLLSVFPSFWPLCPSCASPNDFLDLLCTLTFPLSPSVSCLKRALNSTWETSVQNNLGTFCFCLPSIDVDVAIGNNSHTLRHTSVHILEQWGTIKTCDNPETSNQLFNREHRPRAGQLSPGLLLYS